MLKNINTIKLLRNARIANLQVMKVCLRWYKETEDESWYTLAKEFGEWSLSFKKQIDELK